MTVLDTHGATVRNTVAAATEGVGAFTCMVSVPPLQLRQVGRIWQTQACTISVLFCFAACHTVSHVTHYSQEPVNDGH